MYSNIQPEQDKATIQNRHALSLDNSQTIRSAFLSLMGRPLLLKLWAVLY